MALRLTREYYEHLIEQDITAVEDQCTRDVAGHVALVLRDSVVMHYDFLPAVMRLLNNSGRDGDIELVERIIKLNMEDRA